LKKNLYSVIGNGQPREPALCQLYRHTFVQRRYATVCLQAGGAATIAARMCLSQMRGQRRQTTDSLVSETLLLLLLLLRRPDVIVFC